MAKLEACIAKQDETAVRAEMKQAAGMGIQQTPTLYVNGEAIDGAMPLKNAVDLGRPGAAFGRNYAAARMS